jgi:hypothetical protein
MVSKKQEPKQIIITNCNIKMDPTGKQQVQLELAKAISLLAASLNVEDKTYGIYVEGDTHGSKQ